MPSVLRIHDTLRGRTEPFETIEKGRVKMLVCGPTVQNNMHVGHARTGVFFDTVSRYLAHLGHRVTFLMNMTDIDESIMKGAEAGGLSPQAYAQRFANAFVQDASKLGIRSVTKYPRASNYVPRMIEEVQGLIEKGHAYVVDHDVYFDTTTALDFGQLSHLTPEELTLRPVEITPRKRHLTDFALWRHSPYSSLRWESPWGTGVPGWHIQDAGISLSELGPQYDIHGGARELIYPHHESLIAEAESLTGKKPYVRFWMHTGLLTISKKKMSKSEGNMVTAREAMARSGPSQLRLYFLRSHYREDMEYDEAKLERVDEEFWRLKEAAMKAKERSSREPERAGPSPAMRTFVEAMNDDFDTRRAVNELSKLVHEAAAELDRARLGSLCGAIEKASSILGVSILG
jgi:cysteinyl-tRNA synthetase